MAHVSIDRDYLTLQLRLVDSFLARRRSLSVRLAHIANVRVRPELDPPLDLYADGFWDGIPTRPLPRIRDVAGAKVFCEVHDPARTIAIDLRHDRFGCIVVEVEGDTPESVAARILAAAQHAAA